MLIMGHNEKINYVEFPARDLDATKAFFADVFGWSFNDFGNDYTAFANQPGLNLLPLWRIIILPALTTSPPYFLTPNLLDSAEFSQSRGDIVKFPFGDTSG